MLKLKYYSTSKFMSASFNSRN